LVGRSIQRHQPIPPDAAHKHEIGILVEVSFLYSFQEIAEEDAVTLSKEERGLFWGRWRRWKK